MSPRRPTGPYGYQPDFMNKQAAALRQQAGGMVSRRSSSAALLLSAVNAAGGGTTEGEGAGLVSRSGPPISRQASSVSLFPSGGIARQPSVLASRGRRPSLLGLAPPLVPSLHALPENGAYLGPPRRTSSFVMSSAATTRKGSAEREATTETNMPASLQSDVLDASLREPEPVDENMPLEVSRISTSGSLETASSSLQGMAPLPVVQVSCISGPCMCFLQV